MRCVLVEAVEHSTPAGVSVMFKSKEAKAWEAKVQNLMDMVALHHSEALKCCKADDHKQEQRHARQVEKLMYQLTNLTSVGAIPAGAKLPKLPKI